MFNLISKYMKSGGSMPLKRLGYGDVFMKRDCYFMKINNIVGNAINLETGNLCYFGDDVVVMLMCYDTQKAK